jgi:glycosyltransferase involved in cell wall biosynthesis
MSQKRKTITVHTIVKNEEQWVWYAINSVIDFVDKIMIYDTGSTDKTVAIIKSIKNPKLSFEQKGKVDASGLTNLRQEQLSKTTTDWFFIVDGDEIWTKAGLGEIQALITKARKSVYGIVAPAWNMINDLSHFHPESLNYRWPYAPKKQKGWMNLRLINRSIPGLYLKGDYPLEAYCDKNNLPLQNYGPKRLLFAKNRYFHMTYLPRSSKDKKEKSMKRGLNKIPEIGEKLGKNIKLPEVFYLKKPAIVPSCWFKQTLKDKIMASFFTPFKKIKRMIVKG